MLRLIFVFKKTCLSTLSTPYFLNHISEEKNAFEITCLVDVHRYDVDNKLVIHCTVVSIC